MLCFSILDWKRGRGRERRRRRWRAKKKKTVFSPLISKRRKKQLLISRLFFFRATLARFPPSKAQWLAFQLPCFSRACCSWPLRRSERCACDLIDRKGRGQDGARERDEREREREKKNSLSIQLPPPLRWLMQFPIILSSLLLISLFPSHSLSLSLSLSLL